MTDNEIIKALDDISHNENLKQYSGIPDVAACALDLINSLKHENDRLEAVVRFQIEMIYDTRLEAFKEFAGELKRRLIAGGIFPVLVKNEIDNLVKEMTEGKQDAVQDTRAGEE